MMKMALGRFFEPILRYKMIFFTCLSLPILFGVGAIFILKPVYESEGLLQVGLVQGDPIEEIPVFVNRLDRVFSQLTRVEHVSGPVVRISARAESAGKAQKYLMGITDQIVNNHKNIFRNRYEPQVAYQKYLNDELTGIKRQLDELEKKLESSGESNNVNAILIHLRKIELRNGLWNLKRQYFLVSNNLVEDHWQQTVLLQAPTFPENPKRPKPFLYLSIATILGIALGFFSVFYANSLGYATDR